MIGEMNKAKLNQYCQYSDSFGVLVGVTRECLIRL
jgi:hypothetical protein